MDLSKILDMLPNVERVDIKNAQGNITAMSGVGRLTRLSIESPFRKTVPVGHGPMYAFPEFSTTQMLLEEFSFKGNGNIHGNIITKVYKQSVFDHAMINIGPMMFHVDNNSNRTSLQTDKITVTEAFENFVSYATRYHFEMHWMRYMSNLKFRNLLSNVHIPQGCVILEAYKTRSSLH